MKMHLLGRTVQNPVVQSLVVAVVEALLLQRPLQIPISFSEEQESRIGLPDRGDHCPPIVRLWRGTDAITPGSFEYVIHDQHRHIATDTVALLGNLAERLDHHTAQGWSEGVELNDIRPCREVRISAISQDMTVNLNKGLWGRSQLVGHAGDEQLRSARCPWMIRSHVVGDEVQDQADTTRRKRLPGRGYGASSTKMIVQNIAAYAVGRSHNIVGLPIGKSRVEAD